jgi:hypothetical protein
MDWPTKFDAKASEKRFKALMIDLAMVIAAGLMLAFALGVLVGRMMH